MFTLRILSSINLSKSCSPFLKPGCTTVVLSAGKRWTAEDCIPPPVFQFTEMDHRKRILPILPKVPPPNVPQPKHNMREMRVIRGPCLGEGAKLKHKQYGIIALKGGLLKHGHFEMMRMTINRGIRKKAYLFAEYRVPGVHKPITKHPTNAVMGGGKGKIDYYVTPVKARQVVVEVGGNGTFEEVYKFMRITAEKLPFAAKAITHEQLEAMYEEELRIEEENENFITFREIAEKNMQGMRSYLTKYDLLQYGKYK